MPSQREAFPPRRRNLCRLAGIDSLRTQRIVLPYHPGQAAETPLSHRQLPSPHPLRATIPPCRSIRSGSNSSPAVASLASMTKAAQAALAKGVRSDYNAWCRPLFLFIARFRWRFANPTRRP